MVSIVDLAMARRGTLDPDFAGINWARAGDQEWHRDRFETQSDFLARVRVEAHAAGYRIVDIGGAIEVGGGGPGGTGSDGECPRMKNPVHWWVPTPWCRDQ